MKLVQIPKQNVEEVWHIVVKDIADALARSNGYALADHIKCSYGFYGIKIVKKNILVQ